MAAILSEGWGPLLLGLNVRELRHAIFLLAKRDLLDIPLDGSPNVLAHWGSHVLFFSGFETGDLSYWSSAP